MIPDFTQRPLSSPRATGASTLAESIHKVLARPGRVGCQAVTQNLDASLDLVHLDRRVLEEPGIGTRPVLPVFGMARRIWAAATAAGSWFAGP